MTSYPKYLAGCFFCFLIFSNLSSQILAEDQPAKIFKAGVFAVDITPTQFPVITNGYFTERTEQRAIDTLMSRALVLDNGETRLAIAVVDNLMIKRELLDEVKRMVTKATGIPENRILISATHTHTAPSVVACLGSGVDRNYMQFLPAQIAKSIVLANKNLVPAKIGWAVVQDHEHNHCRRWIFRSDHIQEDPFGVKNIRAHMHPGHLSTKHIGPSGAVDPDLSLLALKTTDGRVLSVLGNYAMHFFGSSAISADVCGRFGDKFAGLLEAQEVHPNFVGILSQGTSGDSHWMDYSQPRKKINLDQYAEALAKSALTGFRTIQYHDWVPLAMAEQTIKLRRRTPDEERLKWARARIEALGDNKLKTKPDIYAHEQICLHDEPEVELKLQAIRIGDLGITALPDEVYGITGLKLKAQSPLETTFNIELANGAVGYIPPPEQHHLGGYTTWPARTAGLEVQAEPRIVETLLTLLEKVAGKPRRKIKIPESPYSKAIVASKPIAYWKFEEMEDFIAVDQQQKQHGTYEPGVARYLSGPQGAGISTGLRGNRAAHFAGGRMESEVQGLGDTYSVECWFWNGFPHDARLVTGYFFSRGKDGDTTAAGDHLGIGGTYLSEAQGKLIFFNGNKSNQVLIGKTELQLRTWNHVVLVREGGRVAVYLNGQETPEISGEAKMTYPSGVAEIFVGGRNDKFAPFEGKVDEVSLYSRALSPQEIAAHFKASAVAPPKDAAKKKKSEPQAESQPLSPEQSLATIHVPEGYEIELVASEPLVKDPVAIAWDAEGRLWVAEMADYPLGMDGNGKPGGRIRVLQDTNQDGKYDQPTLFLDGLIFPTGLLPWKQGVLITAAPEIIYAEDTDGDGKADKRETLFTGFHEGNQQLRVNGLRLGLDNWIYCASGSHTVNYGADSRIQSVATGAMVEVGSRDFRIRPATGELDPQSGPTQYGRNRDDWGNWFGNMNSLPLWHYVLKDHYTRRNPHIAPPDPRKQLILPRNPKVYPAKAPQKRFHNFQQSGRFTSACSAMIYRDRLLFPEDTNQHAFTCEPFHNLVQHFVVKDDGVTFVAERSSQDVEYDAKYDFFASTDRWCRPVMATTGPDGALWVVDMYRYMIEHPQWLTPEGREELKPFYRHGENQGRIYRIFPKGKGPREIPNLKSLSNEELVQHLENPNGTQRDLIQELLIQRADPAVDQFLVDLLKNSPKPLARLHALCTLDGLGSMTPEILLLALSDKHPGVQKHAIRIAEPVAPGHPQVLDAATQLVTSPDAKVRLQLACSLGEWPSKKSATALAQLMIQDQSDAYLVAAAMSSISDQNIETVLHTVLLKNENSSNASLTNQLIEQAIAFGNRTAALNALHFVLNPENTQSITTQLNFVSGLFKALKLNQIVLEDFIQENDPDESLLKQIKMLTGLARKAVTDADANQSLRIAAIPVLAQFPQQQSEELQLLAENLTPQTAPAIQSATITFLSSFPNAEVAELLLENWQSHAPTVRAQILSSLLSRSNWLSTLLDQLEDGKIAVSEIDAVSRQNMLATKDSKTRARIDAILKTADNSDRNKVVQKFRAALTLQGDPSVGKAVFKKKCAVCHKLENEGYDIGPNIASLTDRKPETLLTSILNPSAAVDSKYLAYTVLTDEGRTFSGVLASETGSSITLVMQENKKQVILRNQIEEIQSTGKSMMPDGLEEETTPQDFADLISYLRSEQLN